MNLILLLTAGLGLGAGRVSAFLAPRSATKAPYILSTQFRHVPDQYIVTLHDNHTLEDHCTNLGFNVSDAGIYFSHWPASNSYLLTLLPHQTHIIHDLIRHDAGTAEVMHDIFVEFEETSHPGDPPSATPPVTPREAAALLPKRWNKAGTNDEVWNLAMISAGKKIDIVQDRPAAHKYESVQWPGLGVNVYVMDSGIRLDHIAFDTIVRNGLRRARNFLNLQSSDPSPFCRAPGPGDNPREFMMDDHMGHGTHVAGTIVGRHHGVANYGTVVNVKIQCGRTNIGTSIGKFADAIHAIVKEHKEFKAKPPSKDWRGSVINISAGMPAKYRSESGVLLKATRAAAEAGIPIAAAAGNDGTPEIVIPASYRTVFSVGASTADYRRYRTFYTGSQHSARLDIFAPGAEIYSAWHTGITDKKFSSGTSHAAPHVAGVMAIFMSYESHLSFPTAEIMYERLRANALPEFIDRDPDMVKAGTKGTFLQSGINSPNKRFNEPYAGLDQSIFRLRRRQDSPPENLFDDPAFHTYDDKPETNPSPPPVPAPPSGFLLVPPLDPTSLTPHPSDPVPPLSQHCTGAVSSQSYASRSLLHDTITETFCPLFSLQGTQDPNSGGISRSYFSSTPSAFTLSVDWPPGTDTSSFVPSHSECKRFLADMLVDGCDGNDPTGNPRNVKAGGTLTTDDGSVVWTVRTTGGKRVPADRPAMSGCKVREKAVTGRKTTPYTDVWIWGAGWADSDKGSRLLEGLYKCGVPPNRKYPEALDWKFEYGMGDDGREWSAGFLGGSDGERLERGCIIEAIVYAGGPKVDKCIEEQ